MFIFLLRITPAPRQRQQILEMLRSVVGHTSVKPGCIACGTYEAMDDEQTILYMERWESKASAHPHIQSAAFEWILAAIDLSAHEPEIKFYDASQTWGMELVQSLRIKEPKRRD